MDRREVPADAALIRQGDRSGELFLIDSGRFAVLARRPDGTRLRMRVLQAGAFVGEVAMYAGIARSADVHAEEAGVVYAITPARLSQVLEQDPALAAVWHRTIAEALAERLHRSTLLLRDQS